MAASDLETEDRWSKSMKREESKTMFIDSLSEILNIC